MLLLANLVALTLLFLEGALGTIKALARHAAPATPTRLSSPTTPRRIRRGGYRNVEQYLGELTLQHARRLGELEAKKAEERRRKKEEKEAQTLSWLRTII